MGYLAAHCTLKMHSDALGKVIPLLCALCFDKKKATALALVEHPPKTFEQILLEHIGRYSGDGSYIEMADESGAVFRWVFANGAVHKVKPTILWPELAAQ